MSLQPPTSPMVSIRGLTVSFGNRQILRGIDLDVPKGETLAVMGLSGVGKSTLIRSIVGLVKPQSGQISIFDQNVVGMSESALNKIRVKLGMVFQSPALFDSMTIGDNVAFPLREHTRKSEAEIQRIVSETLSLVDLEGMEHLLPSQLSGGMQKRASIARAVCTGAELILYDEPTTGLDPIISNVINQLIRSLQKQLNVTSIVITHDLNSAYVIADQIAFLYNGEIVEKGTPSQFQNSSNPYVVQFREGRTTGPIRV
jgi:phospholipid/cholesterol/gamma-HCH transport system ATP-binding protein